MSDDTYSFLAYNQKPAWWQLHKLPARWWAALTMSVCAAFAFYILAPGSADVAASEKQALAALAASLVVAVLLSVLSGMLHRGRKLRAGLLLLLCAALANAIIFVGFASLFGLFGF